METDKTNSVQFWSLGCANTLTIWDITVDGTSVGDLYRERPCGYLSYKRIKKVVRLHSAPWQWEVRLYSGKAVSIPEGMQEETAFKMVRAALGQS